MARYMPGGRVVLSSGEFELSGPVRPGKSHTTLQGMGHSTLLRPHAGGFTNLIAWDYTASSVAPEHGVIEHLQLLTTDDDHWDLNDDQALYVRGMHTRAHDIHTRGCGITLEGEGHQELHECQAMQDGNTNYDFTGITVLASNGNGHRHVVGCSTNFTGAHGILVSGGRDDLVAGCTVHEGGLVGTADRYGIGLFDSDSPTAAANIIANDRGDLAYAIREWGTNAANAYVGPNQAHGGVSIEGTGSRGSGNFDQATGELLHHGDQTIVGDGSGTIVTTPDGTDQYRIRVDNNGNVVTDLV